jgi:ribosomal protein S27AE
MASFRSAHQAAVFSHLQERWKRLFDARFEGLLYDLTSTYFECDPPGSGKRRFGYSRDKRFDCVQVVIALIVTREGFPLADEILPGNTLDNQTLSPFPASIQAQCGKAERVWVMDRGIPTADSLAAMRDSDPPVHFLVGQDRRQPRRHGLAVVEIGGRTTKQRIAPRCPHSALLGAPNPHFSCGGCAATMTPCAYPQKMPASRDRADEAPPTSLRTSAFSPSEELLQ